MVSFNKHSISGMLLAALIFIPLFAPNLLDEKAFSQKSILLLCTGIIVLALTFSGERIAQAIERKKE